MERSEVTLQQQLPATLRNLQPAALQALHHHPQAHHGVPTLASQLGPEVHGFDPADASALSQHFQAELGGPPNGHVLQTANVFEDTTHPRHRSRQGSGQLQTPQRRQTQTFPHNHGGQFGVLAPQPPLPSQQQPQHNSVSRLQQEQELLQFPEQIGGKSDGHFGNLKIVPNPPNLKEWRERLFHVDEMITLTEEE